MTVRSKGPLIALLVLMTGIAGCSSEPTQADVDIVNAPRRFDPATDPYWLNQQWDKALLDATQATVHYPVAETDTTTTGPHVTIKFTFANGAIQDPAIISGTGDPSLDDTLLKEVSTAQVPKPAGLHADEPHGFLLDLDMLTPYETFKSNLYSAIEYRKLYPKDAILNGNMGASTVSFDYLDGKASDVTLVVSSKSRELDKASLNAVTRTTMPIAPGIYAGKTLHMEVIFCYTLNGIKNCPDARNLILVQGTRVHWIGNKGHYDPAPPSDH